MPSVLLVTQDLARAGAQRQCVELALGLRETPGCAVEVAVLEPDGPLAGELAAAGIPLHVCRRRWRWDLSPVGSLATLFRRGRYDVVQSFMFLPNVYVRLASLRHRPPVVVSSVRTGSVEGWHRYAAEILSAPLCDLIVANSEAGRRLMRAGGVSPRRLTVIPNGLDLRRFEAAALRGEPAPGLPPGRLIGMCARMERRGDQAGLVRAMRHVLPRHPDARLVLAGDGTMRARVEDAVRRLGLEGRVRLLGSVDRPETVYAALEVYVQASAVREGTSNSIIEAMACGRPVVAVDLGGNREVVVHGETGLLVPPGDEQALAAALLALLDDPERARRMGAAGAARARALYSRPALVARSLEAWEAARLRPACGSP